MSSQREPHAEIEPSGGSITASSAPSTKDAKSQLDIKETTVSETTAGNDTTTFASAGLETYYKPIQTYEGYHRYDPEFAWEPEEERRLVRKIDYRICVWVCIAFFALQLDRSNITQALSDNMLEDIGVNTNDYNLGQTLFFLSFLLAELPSQLISKKIGPDRWIPIQMVSWSLVASMQAFISGRTSFLVTRFLLGMFEGGFIPDNILYLSYYYTSVELPKRLAWFWTSYQGTSIISAFLAYGLLHLRGVNNMAGWRWLFALEGTLTGLIGIVTFFYLPPSPTQTKGGLRGKDGWFNEHEEKIMVNRIIRDDPSKGDMHNRQGLTWLMMWETLCDWHMWPVYLVGLTLLTPTYPMTSYLTLQLGDAGFGTFETNLLTIPAYVLFIIHVQFWARLSEKVDSRFLVTLAGPLWALPLVIALRCLPDDASPWSKWALCTLLVGFPYIHPILVAITSRNAGTVRTRTVASALYNMTVQVSQILGQNIYRENDAPMYRTGNSVLIAVCVYNVLIMLAAKYFYVWINKKRDDQWGAMSKEEREQYLSSTKDEGNKRLDFRFAH